MIRPQVILWIAFLAGAVTSIAVAAPSLHQGRITGVGKAEVMVLDVLDGETETFSVGSDTKIVLDTQPAKLVDLQVGFTAEITAEQDRNGKLIAKQIVATSKISPKK